MKRFIIAIICIYLTACVSLFLLTFDNQQGNVRKTEINDIIYTIRDKWPNVEDAMKSLQGYEVDYIVIGLDGNVIKASREGLKTDYYPDGLHLDYSFEIVKDSQERGKIIFINNAFETQTKMRNLCFLYLTLLFLVIVGLILYIEKNVIRPIGKISRYTKQIADGKYEIPVYEFDKSFFGLLTESFDIMREELMYAKKKEQEADKSRREVIASISHDIKNPVASIHAIAEYQYYTTTSQENKMEYETIMEKASQINGLITNLHTSVLNDLERLEIHPIIEASTLVEKILKKADYKKKLKNFKILECLLVLDKVRFEQVVDNIFANSYKYADTEIEIQSYFEDDYLCICIKDFGNGVKKEEEIFLTQKYYRGKNAQEREGSGMGLYITEYLLKGMQGMIKCESEEKEYFMVKIWLALGKT